MTTANHPLNMHLGRKLRELRKEKNVTPEELASRINTEFKEVNAIEYGGKIMSAVYLYLFARALDVPVERFFEDIPASTPLVGTRALKRLEDA